MRLEGKVVLVTGAAQGTGLAIARCAAREGARVLLTDVREESGRAAASEIAGAGFFPLDVTDEAGWSAAVAEAGKRFGRLDGLVNNAGVLAMGALAQTPAETMERVLRVNALGTMLGVKAAVPALRQAGGGAIVNIGSIESLAGMNSVASYTASKWAVRGFTRSAALELGRDGIRVNCVCPSAGNPEMVGPWREQIDAGRYLRHMPQPVLYEGDAPAQVGVDDVAEAVCFLLSDAAARITGTDLTIDAGWTAGKLCPGLPDF